MLHNEKDTFEQLVLRTSDYLGVKAEIVEKDYDTITAPLLFETVSYDTAITALESILHNGIFEEL